MQGWEPRGNGSGSLWEVEEEGVGARRNKKQIVTAHYYVTGKALRNGRWECKGTGSSPPLPPPPPPPQKKKR